MLFKPQQAMVCEVTSLVPNDPQRHYEMGQIKTVHSILGPHAKKEFGGAGITDNFIQAMVSNSSLRRYVFGIIHYQDIFSQTLPHVTKYCYEIGASKLESGEIRPVHSICAHWDCADEERDQDKREYEEDSAKLRRGRYGYM
jgi:hypothetical protein